jgi:hypothetical protein
MTKAASPPWLRSVAKKRVLKNRIDPGIETAVTVFAIEQTAYGQARVSKELRNRGTFISSGVACTLFGYAMI